jgi:hypothetical protein
LELDLNYVKYYPRDLKYISVFGAESEKRAEIREKIRDFSDRKILKEGFVWRMDPVQEEAEDKPKEEKDDFFL